MQHQMGLSSHNIDILCFITTQSVNLCRTGIHKGWQHTICIWYQTNSFLLFVSFNVFVFYIFLNCGTIHTVLIIVWCKSCYKSTVFTPVGKNTACQHATFCQENLEEQYKKEDIESKSDMIW